MTMILRSPAVTFCGFLLAALLLRSQEVGGFTSIRIILDRTSSALARPSSVETCCCSSWSRLFYAMDRSSSSNNEEGHSHRDPSRRRVNKEDEENDPARRFATGDDLIQLRRDIKELQERIKFSVAMGETGQEMQKLRDQADDLENRDPELVFSKAAFKLREALKHNEENSERKVDDQVIAAFEKDMELARKVLPRFQLEGLWVGKLIVGSAQFEQLINVTYSGDTLTAEVSVATGDESDNNRIHFSRGRVAFMAHMGSGDELKPIEVFSREFRGMQKLPRYKGEGYIDNGEQTVEGQLVMMKDSFRFLWMPLRKNVMFRRPRPEVVLRLLRNTISEQDEMENMREHAKRCFDLELSTFMDGQQRQDDDQSLSFRRIMRQEELEELDARQQGHEDTFSNEWQFFSEFITDEGEKKP